MPESRILNTLESNPQNDPMRQAVESYKQAMRPPKEDLDVDFLIKTLNVVNDESSLKVARNPLDQNGEWRHDAKLHNIRRFEIDDEGRLAIRMRGDNTELSVNKALDQLDRLHRQIHGSGPVMLVISDEKQVQITDIYSHAFVQDAFAGLPFDVVLGYYEEDDKN